MPSIRAPATKKATTLTVAVKCRPLTEKERGRDIVRVINNKEVVVLDPDLSKDYLDRIQNRTKERRYGFDYAFAPDSKNADVYKRSISSTISGVVHGLNATVFAYGSTGSRRKTDSTDANETSSRSHAVLEITVLRKQKRKYRSQVIRGKLALVDLAGSERASETNNGGQKLRDGANINRSLLALANCINALGKQHKKGLAYVPYRNSKLTRILKVGLSGNSQTVMIATISPADNQYNHTVNTLKYADRAKEIKTHIQKNIGTVDTHVSDYQRMIDSLQNEVSQLKTQLAEKETQLNTKSTERPMDDELSWLNILSQETSENVQERINLQKAVYELEETNLKNRTELQHLDDDIAKQQAIENDGTVVQALMLRRQLVLDNIRDNDETGVIYQKEIEANEKRRCQLQEMIDEAISNNANKTYLRILSQYRLLGMTNTELQFEMAMRDQVIHNQRETQRNLWKLLMGLGLDQKQLLKLAAKQGITIEDWTMTPQLGLTDSQKTGHERSSRMSQSFVNTSRTSPQNHEYGDSAHMYCREEHHSSYYFTSHNSPSTYMKLTRSSENWLGHGPSYSQKDEWSKISPGGTSCSEDPLRGQMMNHNSPTQGPTPTPVNCKSIFPELSVIDVSSAKANLSQVGSSPV
ncbi:hypothetical protein M8C21_023367 [Ambrosia artemisiifolia]|uniref:Kinesin-like protein n=1 Tax=Ambrosia artemisiifolia TaxID=4212 RepID=A0AAD5CCJ6_AMBAR|nr:hypothetical protein M8C21_023367 [Ambrosia artemisiifolia]